MKKKNQLVRMSPVVLYAVALTSHAALCDETAAAEQLREELQQLQRSSAEQQATIEQQQAGLQELERSLNERIEAIGRAERQWPARLARTLHGKAICVDDTSTRIVTAHAEMMTTDIASWCGSATGSHTSLTTKPK